LSTVCSYTVVLLSSIISVHITSYTAHVGYIITLVLVRTCIKLNFPQCHKLGAAQFNLSLDTNLDKILISIIQQYIMSLADLLSQYQLPLETCPLVALYKCRDLEIGRQKPV